MAAEKREEHAETREQPEPAEKREEPDYDGRGKAPTTTGDVLLWGPRIVFAPAYLVSEYLLRRPIGFLITGAERSGLPFMLYDLFTFGEDHEAGIFPTAFIDFGFRPSVGFYAFWNDVLAPGHDLRLRGSTGGRNWLAASFTERFRFGKDPDNLVAVRASGVRRPDHVFFGVGPNSEESALVRYGKDVLEASLHVDKGLWRSSAFQSELTFRSVDFQRGGLGDDTLLEDAVAAGALPLPTSYARGYTIARSGLSLTYDDRRPRPAPGSGIRLRVDAAHSANLRETGGFVGYGGSAGGFLDLNELSRVVSLSVMTRFVTPVLDATVPFTELVTLGGAEPMRGFFPGRLADRSAIVLDLAYRWPIWIWLDGAMHAELGNVFGEQLAGFELEKLRWSGAIGVESAGASENPLQLMVGLGSETFESGGRVDSFRFVVGSTNGF